MAARSYTFQNGQTADGGQVETEFNEIYTNITDDNIASGAAIATSKIDFTTTPQAKVYDSSHGAATTGVLSTASFDTQVYDVGDMWDAGAPTRITIPSAGVYLFTVANVWPSNSTGFRYWKLLKNGTDTVAQQSQPAINGNKTYLYGSAQLKLAATDYIELQVFQTSGGNLTLDSGADTTYLSVIKLY